MSKACVARCPFCSSIPKLVSDPGRGGHDDYPPFAYMQCPTCYSRGPSVSVIHSSNFEVEAMRKWNIRKQVSFVVIEILNQEV